MKYYNDDEDVSPPIEYVDPHTIVSKDGLLRKRYKDDDHDALHCDDTCIWECPICGYIQDWRCKNINVAFLDNFCDKCFEVSYQQRREDIRQLAGPHDQVGEICTGSGE